MRAIISYADESGRIAEVGMTHRHITGEYRTLHNLLRFNPSRGLTRYEIYYNWDNRYGKPDRVEFRNTLPAGA